MTAGDLRRVDSRPIPDSREEIRAFMVVWNESVRLESMLKHYRQLGVNRFFMVDAGSTDGTLDLLARAPDVHAFSAAGDDALAIAGQDAADDASLALVADLAAQMDAEAAVESGLTDHLGGLDELEAPEAAGGRVIAGLRRSRR